jgi:hypothetical protein
MVMDIYDIIDYCSSVIMLYQGFNTGHNDVKAEPH